MTLYEIKQEILDCIDLETGEILNPEKLEQLQLDRREKLRNIALLALNCKSDIEAYKEQERRLRQRGQQQRRRWHGQEKHYSGSWQERR